MQQESKDFLEYLFRNYEKVVKWDWDNIVE